MLNDTSATLTDNGITLNDKNYTKASTQLLCVKCNNEVYVTELQEQSQIRITTTNNESIIEFIDMNSEMNIYYSTTTTETINKLLLNGKALALKSKKGITFAYLLSSDVGTKAIAYLEIMIG